MIKRALILLIKFYQKGISPFLYPSCRYTPSCSSYAITAIERYGTLKGFTISIIRILSCNPFFKGGRDQVPDEWPGWPRIIQERVSRLFWRN